MSRASDTSRGTREIIYVASTFPSSFTPPGTGDGIASDSSVLEILLPMSSPRGRDSSPTYHILLVGSSWELAQAFKFQRSLDDISHRRRTFHSPHRNLGGVFLLPRLRFGGSAVGNSISSPSVGLGIR